MTSLLEKECIIFGCGNPLFGDDGLGPEFIEYLDGLGNLPAHVATVDAGTSIRDILFDMLLSDRKPRQIIIVDAADVPGASPGDVCEIDVDAMPPSKTSDYSLHQFPTVNMLQEITTGTPVKVRVFTVQITGLPEIVQPGLSAPVRDALPELARRVLAATMDEPLQEASHD